MNVAQIIPTGEGGLAWLIVQILFVGMFFVFIVYGQRIQFQLAMLQIGRSLAKLQFMRDKGRGATIKAVKEQGKATDPTPSVDRFLEHFMISPIDMDPAGVVWKFDHVVDVRDAKFKDEVKVMAPAASKSEVNNLENMLEATLVLNILYKVTRHYYLLGKRTKSFFIVAQLQMLLPLIMEQAKAFSMSLSAFAEGQPIGDGIGAIVAAELMRNAKKTRDVAKDVVAAELSINGRRAYALKAKGPGGSVGKPGDGLEKIIEEVGGKVDAIIMVDAAVKLEGEKSGSIAEGIGAAIGGIGIERYKIEEVAKKYKIPLYAVVVKESLIEAITPIKESIIKSSSRALEVIKKIIDERVPKRGTIIVAGIGNTIGVL